MPDESSFHPPDTELEQRARRFAERATKILEELKRAEGPSASDSTEALLYFLQSQSCYVELNRREAIERANRDKKEAEDRESRHFWIELIAELVIIALIGWEIHAGGQQAVILQQTNKNTADTAVQIQKAADAVTASLEILRQERAEQARKPSPALYAGRIPIDKVTVRPTEPSGPTRSIAHLHLLLKNEGDAPLSAGEIHALVPLDTNIDLSPLAPAPEYEQPPKPTTRIMSYAIPLTPAGKSLRIGGAIFVPNGHAPFRVTFTLMTPQLQGVTPLGSLAVLAPKPRTRVVKNLKRIEKAWFPVS